MNFNTLFYQSAKQRARWEKIRAKGKWRFVLVWGVLVIGGLAFLISAMVNFPGEFTGRPLWFRLADFVLTFVIMCPVCGGLWGLWMWAWNEKTYLKHLQKQP